MKLISPQRLWGRITFPFVAVGGIVQGLVSLVTWRGARWTAGP